MTTPSRWLRTKYPRPPAHAIQYDPIVGARLPTRGPALAVIAVLSCGCAADDPATVIEQLIEDTEIAAESRDTGHFRGLIADSYVDARGSDTSMHAIGDRLAQ